MDLVPEHRALLGVDVVDSARNPGYQLGAVSAAVRTILPESLRDGGIDTAEVLHWESTGDGALLTLPSRTLGALLDAAQCLNTRATERNRWYKPTIRFRVAVEVGPVGEPPGYYASKIRLNRLLNATEFKDLVKRCWQDDRQLAAQSALIVSDEVRRTVFGGHYARLVADSDFAALVVDNKEYSETAWVHIPGFDPRSLASYTGRQESRSDQPAPQERYVHVSNQAHGQIYGVQAGIIRGDVIQGDPRR